MRLIDADRLNEVIDRNIAYPDGFKQIVDIQPTAYDVNKVVEQLKEAQDRECSGTVPKIRMCEAIEIVKSGMKE